MLKKITSAVFLFVFLLSLFCKDALAHTTTVENSGENRYKAIRLTPEIYNHTNADLSDLRIKDASGEYVPYFINSGEQKDYEVDKQTYPMTLINSYTKDEHFYFDYQVQELPDRDIVATFIEVSTRNTEFAKNIELYGSYDNINWEFVQSDTLYSIDGKSKLNIDFHNIQKYTHYRFQLANNLEKISFETVTLAYNYATQENIYFTESIVPTFSVTEENKKTIVNVQGLYHLKLAEITIDTDSMFKRTVQTPYGGNKELYNLSLNDTSYIDTTIFYNGQVVKDHDFLITINNGDDKPINVTGITVKYYTDELIFEDNGSKSYTLNFEENNTVTSPVYDIVKYKNEILKGNIDHLDIGEVIFDEPVKEPESYDYKTIFNVVVIAVACLLGGMILLKLRKKS